MKLACLDTQILIWAIKKQTTAGQEEMIERATALIDRLEKHEIKMIVPTIVLGEFLIKLPANEHQANIKFIQENFVVAQYDGRSALFYAKIWQAKQDKNIIEQLKNSGKTRQELKADRMIVATALSVGADCIYSHDDGVRKFGDGFIEVLDIPPSPSQAELPLASP